MGRILGIDYGKVRTGLALSDISETLASPLKTLRVTKDPKILMENLLKEITEHNVVRLVVGLPLLLSGKESAMTQIVKLFAKNLEKDSALPLILWDERLTSKEVERLMIEANVKRKKRTAHLDTLSATLILQSYLDSLQRLN